MTLKEKLKELETTHVRVKHPKIDIGDSGMWATGMLMIYDALSRKKKETILMRAKIVNTEVMSYNEKQGKTGNLK